jgi:hypothetical protein
VLRAVLAWIGDRKHDTEQAPRLTRTPVLSPELVCDMANSISSFRTGPMSYGGDLSYGHWRRVSVSYRV